MNEEEPSNLSRKHDDLWRLYEISVQLVMHEGRFISERTNNFLLFNSILFTGFLLLVTQVNNTSVCVAALKMGLPAVGMILSFLHYVGIHHTINAADFWRSGIGLIEKDPEFLKPTKENVDLDIFCARRRYLNGVQTRQGQHTLRLSQLPFKKVTSFHFFHPNQIYGFWLPFLIGMLWLLAFISPLLPKGLVYLLPIVSNMPILIPTGLILSTIGSVILSIWIYFVRFSKKGGIEVRVDKFTLIVDKLTKYVGMPLLIIGFVLQLLGFYLKI